MLKNNQTYYVKCIYIYVITCYISMCYKLKSEQCCTKLKDEINNHTSGKRLHNYGKIHQF